MEQPFLRIPMMMCKETYNSSLERCTQPEGYVLNADDCDDSSSLTFVGATEIEDEKTLCMKDDGDGYGRHSNVVGDIIAGGL